MTVNHPERAFRAWPILTAAARQKKEITYGDLAGRLKIHHRTVRFVLGEIQNACIRDKQPPLTILVINQASQQPSEGFIAWDVSNLEEGREKVFETNWEILPNPFSYASGGQTEDEIADQLVNDPSSSGDVYALVKTRGEAQRIFRTALIKAYGCRCAFCGLTFPKALQGAHIIEWAKATIAERMSVNNGILLCATHHSLFDSGCLTLSPSFKVHYYDPDEKDGTYSDADTQASLALHSREALMPQDKKLWPSLEAMKHNHAKHGWKF